MQKIELRPSPPWPGDAAPPAVQNLLRTPGSHWPPISKLQNHVLDDSGVHAVLLRHREGLASSARRGSTAPMQRPRIALKAPILYA